MTYEINLPEVVEEVTQAFARYEQALVHNLVDELDLLFWHSPHTMRYGAGENLYGYAEIQAFRAARPGAGLARTVTRSQLTTFGRDFATTHLEFSRAGSDRVGRQTQTWLRRPEGWRVVSAHVSLMQ
ncbi:MAG: oxalurate catabolism protein HpxZ [Comamonas sp.]